MKRLSLTRVLGTAAATMALTLGVPASAQAGGAATTRVADALGAYVGAADPNGVDGFSQLLNSSLGYEEDFLAADSWSTIADPAWWLSHWQTSGRQLVLGVPLIPSSGGSLAAGANGAYDAYFAQLAQSLAAYDEGNAILRLGWEFSGGWYKWSVKSDADATNFAAYFRHIVTTMRATAPHLRFDWNPVAGYLAFDLAKAYPGDAYVDYIGLDMYDQSWIANYRDPVARWNDYLNQPYGLDWQRDFARAHGKPMSIPEWGLTVRSDGHGGGDNTYYIDQMYKWISDNDVGYAVYFNFDASDGEHALDDGHFPLGSAELRNLLNGSGAGAGSTGSTSAGSIGSTSPSTATADVPVGQATAGPKRTTSQAAPSKASSPIRSRAHVRRRHH